MKKKDNKNILATSIKYFYTTGLVINLSTLVPVITIILAILFTDKTNITNLFETNINTASMSENFTWFFYLIMFIVNIIIVILLNLISIILGIMGYKLKNKNIKIISVILNSIAFLFLLFLGPVIGYFIIPIGVGLSCFIFALYLEKKESEKNKKNKEL